MTLDTNAITRLGQRLRDLYGPRGDECVASIAQLAERDLPGRAHAATRWNERDVVLITYGDQIQSPGEHPLHVLREFLHEHRLNDDFSTVHLLPFFPYSSDDGFSVIDYRAVDPALGDWNDVHDIGRSFDLMFDLVLNHVSQHSRWFQEYLQGREPSVRYFIEADPGMDLSAVARPRSLPLLTEFPTRRGPRHVWTTFSADQVDLNFAEPQVLVELTEVLLDYIRHGTRFIRLDAVAYLWKQVGTCCIHLPQTHAVVKFFRELLDLVAPHVVLLTETNVPHEENVSYFGAGDEAQMVYQFSLPPLLLDALLTGDAQPLVGWLTRLKPAPAGATFFNFTASHDGIGVRPLEGLISAERFAGLIEAIRARGGLVSTRRMADGRDHPYELNITYFDALGEPSGGDSELHVRRFLASQAVMLALRGIPGVYLLSLLGASNDVAGVRETGQARRINRHKYERSELAQMLADPARPPRRVFEGYRRLLAVRTRQPAFHPDADQSVWNTGLPWLVALVRTSLDGHQRILVLANVSRERQTLTLTDEWESGASRDLLSGRVLPHGSAVELAPYEVLWLTDA